MHWTEAEELAVAVLGMDEDVDDSGEIENAMFKSFDISMEQFQKIAEALMPFTITATAALSNESFHGFVKDGMFICKMSAIQTKKEG